MRESVMIDELKKSLTKLGKLKPNFTGNEEKVIGNLTQQTNDGVIPVANSIDFVEAIIKRETPKKKSKKKSKK